MSPSIIPIHQLNPEEFLFLQQIENTENIDLVGLHSHCFYEIIWFVRTEAKEFFLIDFENYEIQENQIYILSPGQIHSINKGNKKGYVISIASEFFETFCPNNYNYLKYPYFLQELVVAPLSQILAKLLELITNEYNGQRRQLLLESYMSAFLIQIGSLNQNLVISTAKQEKIFQILNLIEQSFRRQKEVGFYADAVNLSIRRCNELMMEATQKTVKQHIIQRIITESKRLIITSDLSIKELSESLGFNDSAYFTRIFKKYIGYTPEQFRKNTFFYS